MVNSQEYGIKNFSSKIKKLMYSYFEYIPIINKLKSTINYYIKSRSTINSKCSKT